MSSSLLKSSGVVGLMTLLSRVLGFVRDILFARAFGAGAGMDVFIIAQAIPNFGRRMFAEGAFSQAFVPVFAETRTRGTHAEARELMAVTLGTLGGVLALITLVGCLAAPLLLLLFGSGFSTDPDKAALGAELLRWTFPYLMFISLTSLCGSVLNTYQRFAVPAVTPVILNLCLIASAYIGPDSVRVLAYAVFVAGILQFAFQLPALARLNMLPRPRWAWSDLRVRRITSLMLPVMFGSGVAQISLLINSNLATWLGDGRVSWLYYADRLMEFPLGIFSIAIGTVILPTLAVQHTNRSSEDFSATLDWGLRMILLIGLPAALGLLLLAGPLVTTIFGYGRFGALEIEMTTYALWAYAFGFLGFSLVKVLVPGFYARQEVKIPTRYGIVSLCAGMVLSLTLFAVARYHDFAAAHAGLALATSFTACLNAGLLWGRLRRDGIYIPQPGWGAFALRLLLAAALMSATVLWLAGPTAAWIEAGLAQRATDLGTVIVAAVVVYFGTLLLSGMRPAHLRRQ
jgi:putative peptidoglycan lipid II flippase